MKIANSIDLRPSSTLNPVQYKIRLLVVIVSWNRPEFLKRTLESLFDRLDEVQADVIVVDNGSNAEMVAVIESEPRLSRFLLLHSKPPMRCCTFQRI